MINFFKKIKYLFMLVQVCMIFIFVYLLMVVLPNYIGCLVPDKLCLIGSNKLNDVLTVSAALLPSLLIFYGYRMWRSQKAKEILAIKAQEVYVKLDELIVFLDILDDQIKSRPGTTSTNSKAYIGFKEKSKSVLKDLRLFNSLLCEENSHHSSEFKGFIDKLNSFDEGLWLINLWRISSGETSYLSYDFSHYLRTRKELKIVEVGDDTANIKILLAKIILHK